MKLIKVILFSLSLFSLGTISALSVQDLIDSGDCPEIKKSIFFGKKLDLSNKNLTSLEGLPNVPGIQQIGRLDLSFNKLTTLPANIFNDLNNLQYLQLEYNKLTTLPHNIFNGFHFVHLSLSQNYFNTYELTNIKKKVPGVGLSYLSQRKPLDLARKKYKNKSIFNALHAREMGARRFVRRMQKAKSKKRKRDSSDNNESLAKRRKS